MNYYSLLPFLSFLVNSFIGIYISYKKPRSNAGRIYIYVIRTSSLWSLFHFLIFITPDPRMAAVFNRLSVIVAAFTAPLFFHFVLAYSQNKTLNKNSVLVLAFSPAILISILSLTTDLISTGVISTYWGTWVTRGPVFKYHALYMLFCCIAGIIILLLSKDTVAKKHRFIIIFSHLFPIIGGLFTEVIAPLISLKIIPLGPELFTITGGIILYGIRRQDFLQITPAMAAETIIQIIPDDIIILNKDSTISFMNNMAQNDFNYLKGGINSISFKAIFLDKEDLSRILSQIEVKGLIENYEAEILVQVNKKAIVSMNGSVIKDFYKNTVGYVFSLRNITDRKLTEEQVKYFAYHDPLTGLANRKSFYEYAEKVINEVQRPALTNIRALLYIDLDNFKYVNDVAGHDIGDIYLQEIAKQIQRSVRKTDLVFRIGGDEFTVLLHTINAEIDAGLVAEKLIESISQPLVIKEQKFYPSVSIGISIFPRDGADINTLIKNADEAMYEAKKEKSRYCFYSPEMSIQSVKRLEILKGIRNALACNQLVNYYQPIVTIDGRIFGVEVLVRWQSPDNELVMPDQFISIAENSRLIKEIDERVLRNACREIQSLPITENHRIKVFVNFSALHINEKNVAESVKQILREWDFDPAQLVIEVTEDFIIDNSEYVQESFHSLGALGIRMAIDDFGTKYSTVSSILNYPFSYLKIDQSFLREIADNQRYVAVIEGILKTAEKLGITVIAEGVETPIQHEILKGIGYKLMQGFLYSKPVPYAKLKELITGD